jgi:hypothetical protein
MQQRHLRWRNDRAAPLECGACQKIGHGDAAPLEKFNKCQSDLGRKVPLEEERQVRPIFVLHRVGLTSLVLVDT